MEEIRRNGIVIKKEDKDITYLEDTADFKKFKNEVLDRIEKLEEDIKKFKAVKKVEYTK